METKNLIKFIKCDVMDWDGWDDEQREMFVAIIESLQEYDEFKGVIEFEKMMKINLIKEET